MILYPLGNPEHARQRRASAAFAGWLRTNRQAAAKESLQELIRRSGMVISWSAAYRVATKLGIRGRFRNRSKYDRFWASINWRLPDAALAEVWGVMRGNLRQRRIRMQVGQPRWSVRDQAVDPDYRRSLAVERRKAERFVGPRPC